jgi:2-polyprenyl-3-methyl-5-hydroxy-6-metoxy-1,4-benzoquinol methylase
MTLCPLCNEPEPFLVQTFDVSQLIEKWHRVFHMDVTSELQCVEHIELFKCAQCQLQFFMPNHLAGSAQLYVQLEKFDWYYMPRWEHDVALEELHPGQTLLEIGCGFGQFVERALSRGIQAEGIDLNDSAVAVARQRGIPVRRLELRELIAAPDVRLYDTVCSFQVLEHVPNPKEFLEWSCALIKPGGQLFVCVPNAGGFLKYLHEPLDMPPHHLTRWSSQTMHMLAEWLPVRLQQIQYEPLAPYHTYGYVQAWGIAHLKRSWLRGLFDVTVVPSASLVLSHLSLRRKLIGQTLYASFTRL